MASVLYTWPMRAGALRRPKLPVYEEPDDEEGAPPSAPRQRPMSAPRPRCTGLVADDRPGERVFRRRYDCLALFDAEESWILREGGTQAMCPEGCAGFTLG